MHFNREKAKYVDQLEEDFQRFIQFGQLLDVKTRAYLVQYLRSKIDPETRFPPMLKEGYFGYFCTALDEIFAADLWQSLLHEYTGLAVQVSRDTLNWIRKAHIEARKDMPFEEEEERLGAYNVMPQSQWTHRWYVVTNYLGKVYTREELPVAFYSQKFKSLINGKTYEELDAPNRKELRRISQDLLAQWDAKFQAKLLGFQLKRLKKQQDSYKELLNSKMEEFQKLQQIIAPFANYGGVYWDLSQGLWKESSFSVLESYQELLADEASIRELADMLGKMRQAELQTEEEQFDRVIERQQWLQDTSLKSEIVGIQEGNDLNTVLSSEVSLLSDPDTETVFFKKYADKSLLTLKYDDQELTTSEHHFTETFQQVKKKEKGPFILCVDTSDSMSGRPEQIAKVLCFAILKMAAEDNRRAFLINFSTGIQVIDLYDIAQSLDTIAQFLKMSFQAGTDISLALYEAFRQLDSSKYTDADVLVISDYVMYELDEDLINRIQHYQQNKGTQFHSLILNNIPNTEVVRHFDNVWIYNPESKGIIRTLAGDLQTLAAI
ncbi:MAG: VWA domain-containing protein [Bacteroidota bacterium]